MVEKGISPQRRAGYLREAKLRQAAADWALTNRKQKIRQGRLADFLHRKMSTGIQDTQGHASGLTL